MPDQSAIFAPAFATILLTLAVWAYMYARRIPFILNSKLTDDQLASAEFARISPPQVANPSDNLKNLFEIPVLFYFLSVYLFATQQVDATYTTAAWVFFAFRVAHSIVHCSVNVVVVRFYLYLASTLAVWFMALRAGLTYLGW